MDDAAKKIADKIYAVGFRNGQLEMKYKVLKKINRDWTLAGDLTIKILKMVNNLKLSRPKTTPHE